MNGSELEGQWGEPPGTPRPRPVEQTSVPCRVLALLPVRVTTAVPDSGRQPPMLHWSPRAQTTSVGLSMTLVFAVGFVANHSSLLGSSSHRVPAVRVGRGSL